MKPTKIKQTSPDKVRGKLVKYRKGDIIAIKQNNDKFMAALISNKFNKYYDITLIDFYEKHKPTLDELRLKRFYGTKIGSWEDVTYAVNVRMITCKYIDEQINIEKVGEIEMIDDYTKDGYAYLDNLEELEKFYLEELPIRIQKTINAEKFTDLAFVSKHLIDMKHIEKTGDL
ncbi:hypothetical protein SAMN05660841_04123 [Sphingobacterium nematocida]|uniref:Immunity protein 26 n=1 Tax=Sphingobacterium nematocida TaxID=1513896 RepID=A0A1T5GJA6_9SPHI|nr:hypothetical protein [Sphingobacterium nematocida]SKC08410.1 hypothetical protein SAMN05660841_04123 [Sphingobacterium nematocida]